MNEENFQLHEALRTIAAGQDLALAQMPRSTDAIAEEAMRRAWTKRRRPILPYLAVAGLAGAAAFAVAFLVLRTARKDLHFEIAGRAGQAGASVTAAAGTPLPLQFSDGSKLVFEPGAQARVSRLTDNGAELLLEAGRLVADVRHTGEAHWSVSAGPFKVIVTGTRFAAEWVPATRKLSVEMFEGSVLVEGPSLGAGLALRAGETLVVGASSLAVVTRTVKAAAAVTNGPPPASEHGPAPAGVAEVPGPGAELPAEKPTPTPDTTPQRSLSTWTDLAASGRYAEALKAAERGGFARLCAELDAERLLALGDAARYASSSSRARQAFQSLVRRFPRDQRSDDARFALGRLESAAGDPQASARWFERYLTSARRQPLAEEAAGRLVEIYDHVGDKRAAARAAHAYLERHPDGPRAGLARKVLAAQPTADLER
jgi:TolA-binding protein